MKTSISAAILAVLWSVSASAAPSFSLLPADGTVHGTSGSFVGWGYDITNNNPSDWLVLNDSYVSGSLSTGTYGTYMDYLSSNFIVIDPSSSTGLVPFIAAASGTGEFDIAASVPPNTLVAGDVNIDYSFFSQNPNSPTFNPVSFVSAGTVSTIAQVDINPVPEPTTILMMAVGLGSLALTRRRHRRMTHRLPDCSG